MQPYFRAKPLVDKCERVPETAVSHVCNCSGGCTCSYGNVEIRSPSGQPLQIGGIP